MQVKVDDLLSVTPISGVGVGQGSWKEFFTSTLSHFNVFASVEKVLKGPTIRKVMGGVGKKPKKNSCKGKCPKKKFMQGKMSGKKFMHKMGLILI